MLDRDRYDEIQRELEDKRDMQDRLAIRAHLERERKLGILGNLVARVSSGVVIPFLWAVHNNRPAADKASSMVIETRPLSRRRVVRDVRWFINDPCVQTYEYVDGLGAECSIGASTNLTVQPDGWWEARLTIPGTLVLRLDSKGDVLVGGAIYAPDGVVDVGSGDTFYTGIEHAVGHFMRDKGIVK